MKRYQDVYTSRPVASGDAPGRVNLLGEHTDYNDGFVLPTAIAQRTRVTLGRAAGREFSAYSANLGIGTRFTLESAPREAFACYLYGCVRMLADEGVDIPPLDLHVQSDVPIGVGLSSSAALEVATLRALRELLAPELSDVRIAQLAQQAEIRYAGVRCGIMDQMASSLADTGHMLFIDTRSLERRLMPLPADSEILVLDCGVSRALASGAYNQRRDECEAAARQLGVATLRELRSLDETAALPEPLRRRARHVYSENERVLQACRGIDGERFGQLMNASHDSLRDDFEVSHAALDRLVDVLRAHDAVHGARLTGAGFGGACVALCRRGNAAAVAELVLPAYAASGWRGRLLVPAALRED